jgi:hypothetical protein
LREAMMRGPALEEDAMEAEDAGRLAEDAAAEERVCRSMIGIWMRFTSDGY